MRDKILIVDDEPMAAGQMAAFFQRRRYVVSMTSDPKVALQAIACDDSVNAVITDLKMPVIDGFSILEAARRRRLDGRLDVIIAVTGHATLEDEQRALNCGAMHFLQKPLNLRQILSLVKPVVRRPATSGNN